MAETQAQRLKRLTNQVLQFTSDFHDEKGNAELRGLVETLLPRDVSPEDERALASLLAFGHPKGEIRPENVSMAARTDDSSATTSIAFVTDKVDGRPMAMMIDTLHTEPGGAKHQYIDYVVVDTRQAGVAGLNDQMTKSFDAVASQRGAVAQTLLAAWIGRLVWAQRGFDFQDDTERQAFREQFGRFLAHHNLAPESLRFRREDGTLEPFGWDKLDHPWDYAHLFSVEGTIIGDVVAGAGRIKRDVALDVGRAFLLGDYYDPAKEPYVATDWHAVRPVERHGPGWEQFQAWAARTSRAAGP